MNITSSFELDKVRKKPQPGAYEWWYYDAVDETKHWQIVVIFYDGCPFSPFYHKDQIRMPMVALARNHPAISISLYRYGKPVFYSMTEYASSDFQVHEAASPEDEYMISVGKNRLFFRMDGDGRAFHRIELDERLPSGDALSGTLNFEGTLPRYFGDDRVSPVKHQWNLTLPNADVKASLKLVSWEGVEVDINFKVKGYHDHNIGFEPMEREFEEWYWGRFHFEKHTLVYYLMRHKGREEHQGWVFNHRNETVYRLDEAGLSNAQINVFLLKSSRKIELSGDGVEVTIQQSEMIDSGPFYQRFLAEAFLHLPEEAELAKSIGITEYIRPSRIHAAIFRPLVRMRYHKKGSSHWVQKSPRLYRWTW